MNSVPATSAQGAFDRLVQSVTAAENAFRRLVSGAGGAGTGLIEETIRLERERARLIAGGTQGYRDQLRLLESASRAQLQAVDRAGRAWSGFADGLGITFERLFDRIVKDGRVRLDALFRAAAPLVGDVLGRLTGVDLRSLAGGLMGGFGAAGGTSAGSGLLAGGANGTGGLFGGLFGGQSGIIRPLSSIIGSLLPIPGAGLVAAALPVVASLFADKDYPFAVAGISTANGSLASSASELDGGPVEKIAKLGEQIAETLQTFFEGIGATVGDLAKLTAVGYSSGRKSILPKGFFAGVDEQHGADFATGAVFSGIEDPEEATLRAVQSGLLRAFRTGSVSGVSQEDAETLQVGLRRAMAAEFTSLRDGLADIEFLRDFPDRVERLRAAGDAAAVQRLDLREKGGEAGGKEAEQIRDFLARAARLFGPLDQETDAADAAPMPVAGDDAAAAERLAEARAAVDDYVRALLGIEEAVADTKPLTGYALQLAEAEARLDGLSGALREAGYSAEAAADLIAQGKDAARERLRGAYEDELGRDLRNARGLGIVDEVSGLVERNRERREQGTAVGADISGLDELLRLQVQQLVGAGQLSVAALQVLHDQFADNAVVADALTGALSLQAAAANDNVAAQMTLADVTRLATRELDAQVREQEEVGRSAKAVVEAIADTRRRLALDASLSVLSPAEQLEAARQRFEDVSGRASAGDQLAQAELPEAGEAYLELARDFYASSEDYARIFRQVDDALRDTGEVADRQLQVAEQQLDELRELRRALTGELGDLPNPNADFGYNPTRNRILARLTGYAGDFGNGGFGAFRAGLSPDVNALVDTISAAANFADGGVMTAVGPLPLHRYGTGGVASAPQLALFGEGRMPEAFVPLPDGRSIPVTVSRAPDRPVESVGDAGAARRTAGIEALVEETRRLRADMAGLRSENAALRRGLERLASGVTAGRAA